MATEKWDLIAEADYGEEHLFTDKDYDQAWVNGIGYEKERISTEIYEWFDIMFKTTVGSEHQEYKKGQLVALIFALRSCDVISSEQMGLITDLLIWEIPIKKNETHIHEVFQ